MIRFIKQDYKLLCFFLIWIIFVGFFFQQTFLVSSQVTFLFVLFLASVNLASANPVCTGCGNNTADSASVKVSPVFIVNSIKLKHMLRSYFVAQVFVYFFAKKNLFCTRSFVIISASGGFRQFLKSLRIELSDIFRLPGCSFVQVYSLFLRDMWSRVFRMSSSN